MLLDLADSVENERRHGRARETYQQALDADPNYAETILKYSDFLFTNREAPLAKQLLAGSHLKGNPGILEPMRDTHPRGCTST